MVLGILTGSLGAYGCCVFGLCCVVQICCAVLPFLLGLVSAVHVIIAADPRTPVVCPKRFEGTDSQRPYFTGRLGIVYGV